VMVPQYDGGFAGGRYRQHRTSKGKPNTRLLSNVKGIPRASCQLAFTNTPATALLPFPSQYVDSSNPRAASLRSRVG